MYGLNAVALIFFCGINILAYKLCRTDSRRRRRTLTVLCSVLLGGNVIRYTLLYPFWGGGIRIPVEFSTVAYFAVPAILLLGRTSLKSWAAYSGLMAGFFYYLAMISAGGPLYNEYPAYDIYISMFCHGTLYFCGFVTVATVPMHEKDGRKLVLGVLLVAAQAMLLRPLTDPSETLLIYILLDGVCVKRLLPQALWQTTLPLYYILMAGLVLLTIRGFFRSSRKQYRKFSQTAAQGG